MYFWRGYYFGKEGIWCRDFNKEEAFCVLKDSLYKDYMVRAIADNGKTIAVSRDINTNEPLLMVDVDKKYNPQNEMYQKLKRNVHFLI